ncbi:hypothetical protein KFL_000520150 [Klebsormidium nitens]|uniref:DUF3754 domain-containing protein n=1 Tax=Klebsormidium nitens TaxID=105231 RepID=A0A1Y1HNW9_KLENI|nr:hypothetical protein KFL_000520150 [Klebsormidium nitens]|eukprot:GAQ80344.1 hypothetical protein KFL_000520150 [Klebsormidium nitens]
MQILRGHMPGEPLMLPLLRTKRKDVLKISKEAVIQALKPRLVLELSNMIESESEQNQFKILCKRIDASVRSWYNGQFEELTYLYSFFDPVTGPSKISQYDLSSEQLNKLEVMFLKHVMQMFEKSNFKLVSQSEYDLAQKGEYLLTLPIEVDLKRLDTRLWSRFFATEGRQDMPSYSTHYLLFRGGIGIDQTSGFFVVEKIELLMARLIQCVLWPLLYIWNRLVRCIYSTSTEAEYGELRGANDEESACPGRDDISLERVRLENMQISLKNLVTKTTIQEPTFERIILLYRKATAPDCPDALGDRAIYIKHFQNIPMADMELVLPEKRNPGLTPMDSVKMAVSAIAGAGALWHTLTADEVDFKVLVAIVTAVGGYIFKVHTDYQIARNKYQSLLVKSMYDKSMDNGKSTLLHLCDDVIQQEVKEVILAYFVLMTRGKLSEEELDGCCEDLLENVFGEAVNFEVSDAIGKLEHLKLVSKDLDSRFSHQVLTEANLMLGPTYEELFGVEKEERANAPSATSRQVQSRIATEP